MIVLDLKEQGEKVTIFGEPDPAAPALEFECTIAAGKLGPDPHIHPRQTETFRVTQERMKAVVDGEEREIGAGETLVVTPGQVHSFWNPDPDHPVTMRITIEPPLHFQWFLTEAARSAVRGGGRWKDASLLETAWILYQVVDEHDYPGIPRPLKRPLFGVLAGLAVLLRKTGRIEPLVRRRAGTR
jgi:mannose-6-phosphate isomerase-like protein (cupin superfamily)